MRNGNPADHLAATSSEINRLVSASFAPTTKVAYELGVGLFDRFRASHGLPLVWPSPPQHVVHFAASLSLSGKALGTVRTYLAGVGTKHKLNGWVDPTDNFLLRKLLQGMARLDHREDRRLPITLQRLQELVGVLPTVCVNTYEVKLFTAAFTLAFFGFFRVSELVGQGEASRAGRRGLGVSDIVLNNKLSVKILGSKTDQCQKGIHVFLDRVPKIPAVCPVFAMQVYLQARPPSGGALLIHFNGKPFDQVSVSSNDQEDSSGLKLGGF